MSLRLLSDKKKEKEKHHDKKRVRSKHLKDDVSFIDFQPDLSLSKEVSKNCHSQKVNLRRHCDGTAIRASTTQAKEAIQRRITHQKAYQRWLIRLAEIPMGTYVPRHGTSVRNCPMEGHFSNTCFTN